MTGKVLEKGKLETGAQRGDRSIVALFFQIRKSRPTRRWVDYGFIFRARFYNIELSIP